MSSIFSVPDNQIEENYEMLEVLGGGTYGIVYKARDRRTGLLKAIKMPRIVPGHDACGIPPSCVREAAALRLVQIAQVPFVMCPDEILTSSAGAVIVVMPLADGVSGADLAFCALCSLARGNSALNKAQCEL